MMQTTTGFLTYLAQRLGAAGLLTVVLVALAIAIVAGITVYALGELLAAPADSIQVAPVRWLRRI